MSYNVTRHSMRHRQQTKEYNFLVIHNTETDKALVMFRWGKTGTLGQVDVHTGTQDQMTDLYLNKVKEKQGRGYSTQHEGSGSVVGVSDVQRLVTAPIWTKLGAANIQYVMPTANITGVPEAPPKPLEESDFEQDKNGNWRKRHTIKPMEEIVETEEQKQAREQAELEAKRAVDPLWGMF